MSRDELLDAIDGLFAYDTGAVDSGIHDEALKARVVVLLGAMDDDDRRSIATDLYGHYGQEDISECIEWMDEQIRASR